MGMKHSDEPNAVGPVYLNEGAWNILKSAIDGSDATTPSEVIIGVNNFIQHLLIPENEKLKQEVKMLRNAQFIIKYIAGIPEGTMEQMPEYWKEVQKLCKLNDEKYVSFMRGHNRSPGEETDPMVDNQI